MVDSDILIRTAAVGDVGRLVDFNLALCCETEGRELDRVTVSKGVGRFVNEPAHGRYFVAEIGG